MWATKEGFTYRLKLFWSAHHLNGEVIVRDETKATRVWLILWKAARAIEQNALASISELGLGLSDFAVLEVLLHKGPLLVNALGRKILLSSGSITVAVDRLENKGLVQRVSDPADLRARIVQLTAEGRSLAEQAFKKHSSDMEETLAVLRPAERLEMIRLLKKAGLWAASRLETLETAKK